ncbi:hypothetical protein GL50803_005742 [Giardia duodenalis]|uniref:Uncharacterized protein n=1 Tax=Giardia intestinalis (strain ATCC 50803 / WB clone C6) TaxID=184922 RepID=A8BR92_GIAIC|nr:hypothetical protein GL50803_005742 [Giardia intestinalis]KAE8304414.1 hypothetical protein GL50803_005742 [Giardia intestinalis]|eukprot:XP_001705342.1 Hypothetical protein GL50803_5742 [Giardia lamblia ATCC 50803]
MTPDDASLRLLVVGYVTGEGGDSEHLPECILRRIDSIVSSLILARKAYLQFVKSTALQSKELLQPCSPLENPCPRDSSTVRQSTPIAVPILGGTPETTELVRLLDRTHPTVDCSAQLTEPSRPPQTPEHRRLSLMERLQPCNLALPSTPASNPLTDFESYTIFQLRQSLKQLGKKYFTREQAIQTLRREHDTHGWLPNIHLTQFQLMSPARRQTLEETITDWIKASPWYLLILTFVPVNKYKMLEHMKKCKINVSLETLSNYLLNNNVLMAEREETNTTSLDADKLKIRYPKENGEKQLTLSEIITPRGRKAKRKIRR